MVNISVRESKIKSQKINAKTKNHKKFYLISVNNVTKKKDVFKMIKYKKTCIVKHWQTL